MSGPDGSFAEDVAGIDGLLVLESGAGRGGGSGGGRAGKGGGGFAAVLASGAGLGGRLRRKRPFDFAREEDAIRGNPFVKTLQGKEERGEREKEWGKGKRDQERGEEKGQFPSTWLLRAYGRDAPC